MTIQISIFLCSGPGALPARCAPVWTCY